MIPKPKPEQVARLTGGGAESRDEKAIAALLSRLPASAAPDDLAVERAWRRITTPEKRAGRPGWLWFAGLAPVAVALMLLLGGPLFRSAAPSAELALTSGAVFSGKLAASWHASERGEPLEEADRLRTDATGRAMFRIGPSSARVAAVLVRENSDVGLERLHHGTFLRLSRGTLTARVSKRPADEPFVVETDRYSVKVVGTLFTVEQGPGDYTAVSVREGVVLVSDRAGHVDRVVAGERWASESREARVADRTPDGVKTLLEDGLAGKPAAALVTSFTALTSNAAPAEAMAHASKEPAVPVTTAAPVSHEPDPVVPPLPRAQWAVVAPSVAPVAVPALPVVAPVVAPGAVITSSPMDVPTATPLPPVAATVPPEAAVSAPPPPAPLPSAESSYARGIALESRGDYEAAAQQLQRASDEDAAHGDVALYALGRLAQRRLHDGNRASAAYHLYRTRYPTGPLLPEVDLAILELEVESHADSAALTDSTRFLAAHPTSERLDQVHLLRGNLLRDAGRCTEALGDYAAVRAAPFTDHALYSTAYCQRNLGDRVAAAKTLRDYLVRFPSGAHRAEAERALEDER